MHQGDPEQPRAVERALRGRLDERFDTAHLGGLNLDAREAREIQPRQDPRLRLGLLRGRARRAAHRGPRPHPRRRRAGLGVPLPQPGGRAGHALRRGQPVRRDLRHPRRGAGAAAQGRPGDRRRQRRSARRSPASATAASTCTRARRCRSPRPSRSPTRSTAFALLALHLGRMRDLAPTDGKRIIDGPAAAARADRGDPRPVRGRSPSVAKLIAQSTERDVHRPRPRLAGGAGGRAEAQGGLLRARRGLPGGRAQARAAGADQPGDADGRDRPRRRAARQEHLDAVGDQGAQAARWWRWRTASCRPSWPTAPIDRAAATSRSWTRS